MLHVLSQGEFRKIPLSGKVLFRAAPGTARILDFLVWVTETCTYESYVTIVFYSFLNRRISKVIPSHQLVHVALLSP